MNLTNTGKPDKNRVLSVDFEYGRISRDTYVWSDDGFQYYRFVPPRQSALVARAVFKKADFIRRIFDELK